jgi:hypothetical protein
MKQFIHCKGSRVLVSATKELRMTQAWGLQMLWLSKRDARLARANTLPECTIDSWAPISNVCGYINSLVISQHSASFDDIEGGKRNNNAEGWRGLQNFNFGTFLREGKCGVVMTFGIPENLLRTGPNRQTLKKTDAEIMT